MVYFDNTTESQRVFIPRTDIQASAYHPSTGGTERYYAGNNIEITPTNVINVTGLTEYIQNTVTGMTLDYATTGDVETMITAATSGFVETEALTAYTPTSGFATINNQSITNGGNITIQGGGDSTALEKITSLPAEPVDGAVYNYNGLLIKYVNGEGDWGKWYGINATKQYDYRDTSNAKNEANLTYAVIPNAMEGQLVCVCHYFTNSYLYVYFDLQNDRLNVYTDSADTTTAAYVIQHNGSPVNMTLSYYQVTGSWVGNKIEIISPSAYALIDTPCSVSSSTAHYELVETPTPTINDNNPAIGVVPIVANNGFVEGYAYKVYTMSAQMNGQYKTLFTPNGGSFGNYYAPTTSGATGSLCVAQGNNNAPLWKTIAQALGVDFWVGTEDEYLALSPNYSNTTLYFIKEQ